LPKLGHVCTLAWNILIRSKGQGHGDITVNGSRSSSMWSLLEMTELLPAAKLHMVADYVLGSICLCVTA